MKLQKDSKVSEILYLLRLAVPICLPFIPILLPVLLRWEGLWIRILLLAMSVVLVLSLFLKDYLEARKHEDELRLIAGDESLHDHSPSKLELFFTARVLEALRRRSRNSESPALNVSLAGIFLNHKAQQTYIAYLVLILTLVAFGSYSLIFAKQISTSGTLIILCLILALVVNQAVLEYRITHGTYGTSEYEVRELLAFIIARSKQGRFGPGTGLGNRMIFPEAPVTFGGDPTVAVSDAKGAEA